MNHPAPESLIPHALGRGDSDVARHVAGCRTCRDAADELREAGLFVQELAALDATAPTAACLGEFAVADLLEGRRAEAGDRAAEHLLGCAHCRNALARAAAVLSDADVAREARQLDSAQPVRRRWTVAAVAVAAVVALVLFVPRLRQPDTQLREPVTAGIAAPIPVRPAGVVARADTFAWTAVSYAQQYRLRLHDAQGAVLWRAETADTSLVVPDSVRLTAGVPYFWKVEALTDWRRWTSSPLTEFRTARSVR